MAVLLKLNNSSIGYDKIFNHGKPYTSPMIIDHISINLDLLENEVQEVADKLDEYVNTYYAKTIYTKGFDKSYRVLIQHALDKITKDSYLNDNPPIITLNPEQVAFSIYLKPWGNKHRLKISWNPARIPSKFIQYHLNKIIPNGYERLLTKGKVTELHETFDIHEAQVQDFLMTYATFTYSQPLIKSGAIIGMTLGSKVGDKQFVIYNKTKEIQDTNKNFFWDKNNVGFDKEPVPPYPIMRIEKRHDLTHYKLNVGALKTLPNDWEGFDILNHLPDSFKKWGVAKVDATQKEKKLINKKNQEDMIWRLFVANTKSIGLLSARLLLTPEYRKKYDAILKEFKVNWWKPNFQVQRSNAINKLLYPEPFTQTELENLDYQKHHINTDSFGKFKTQ